MENTKNNPDKAFNEFIEGTTEESNNQLKQECENLLQSTGYDDEEKLRIENELWHYSEEELNQLKANLYSNQVDRIQLGLNYTQTDIKRKLWNDCDATEIDIY